MWFKVSRCKGNLWIKQKRSIQLSNYYYLLEYPINENNSKILTDPNYINLF